MKPNNWRLVWRDANARIMSLTLATADSEEWTLDGVRWQMGAKVVDCDNNGILIAFKQTLLENTKFLEGNTKLGPNTLKIHLSGSSPSESNLHHFTSASLSFLQWQGHRCSPGLRTLAFEKQGHWIGFNGYRMSIPKSRDKIRTWILAKKTNWIGNISKADNNLREFLCGFCAPKYKNRKTMFDILA